MGRLTSLTLFLALVLAGCPGSHPPPDDTGVGIDAAPAIDAPVGTTDTPVRDSAASTDTTATDTGPSCAPVACLDDLGGGCCGTDSRPSHCTATGNTCDVGYVLATACRAPSECGADDWRTCAATSDCVLAENDCCGWCGPGHASDVDAVNEDRTDAHRLDVCPVPTPCPACASGPLDPTVRATCNLDGPSALGDCEVVDLGALLGTCSTAADCEVTYANCCGCGGTDDEVIAIGTTGGGRNEIDRLLCDGGACALDCAPITPSGWVASCDAGRCVARMLTR